MRKPKTDYDKAREKLEGLVDRIQRGDIGLEEMRGEVKTALDLIRQCRLKLRDI